MKSFWLSKSFWAQVVAAVAQALVWAGIPGLNDWMTANPQNAAAVVGAVQMVVAWVMRVVTHEPVTLV